MFYIGLIHVGSMLAAHGQGSSKIPNFIRNCFEGSHGFVEEEGKERQKGKKDYCYKSFSFLNFAGKS